MQRKIFTVQGDSRFSIPSEALLSTGYPITGLSELKYALVYSKPTD